MYTSYQSLSAKISVLLMLGIGLAGCGDKPESSTKKDIIHPAKIFEVGGTAGQSIRNFPAEVEANTDSKLAFRVSGQIIHLPVKAGNDVKKGQLLARLDPKDFKLRLDDRKARFELAKSQFERSQSLLDQKLIARSQFDEAKANLQVAESSLNAAKTDLGYTYLRAPFSGSIANRSAEKHENVQAKQTIFSLQTRDRIDISIQVPEGVIAHVKQETHYEPTITFDSHPGREFLAQVKEWDTQADPTTLTYKVVFSMKTPADINVLPGMTANLRADLFQFTDYNQNIYLLPVESVFSGEDASIDSSIRFVWKLNNQNMTVSRAEVSVGEIKGEGIEILEGIAPGDRIVAAGVHYLQEGMQVRQWDREEGL